MWLGLLLGLWLGVRVEHREGKVVVRVERVVVRVIIGAVVRG